MAEYAYVAQTAFQANEDRARASQLFLVTFATLIAAIYSSQLDPARVSIVEVQRVFVGLFLLIALHGGLTLLQLAKLRLAWMSSITGLNRIKARASELRPELAGCFAWSDADRPPLLAWWSVGFLQALAVAALTGIAAGAAAGFWSLLDSPAEPSWSASLVAAVLTAPSAIGLCYILPLARAAGREPASA